MAEAARELLFSRVVARLVWLRHQGVLDGPAEPHASGGAHERASPGATLWEWSRLISDVDHLLDEVLEPAAREPGRVHRRQVQVHRDHPRGAVHWPRTAALGQGRVEANGPRFWCSTAHRSLLAPENLLLTWTLDELRGRGRSFGARLDVDALLDEQQRASVRSLQARLRQIDAAPWAGPCRAALGELRREGAPAAKQLEREVDERVRGRPSAAPTWARALLQLRRQPAAIPTRAALDRIDAVTLWEQLAWLELLGVLRSQAGLRRREQGFAGAGGLQLRAVAETPAWVISRPERAAIGLLCVADEDWEQVKMQALYWSWEVQHAGRDVDRWVIVHRCGEGFSMRRRAGIELGYAGLPVQQRIAGELDRVLAGWLEGVSG